MNYPQLIHESPMDYLANVARNYLSPFGQALVQPILEDTAFALAPGGKSHHHAYANGLAVHTAEVVYNCLFITGNTNLPLDMNQETVELEGLDLNVLLVAAFWHDFMKTAEYVITGELKNEDGTIFQTLIDSTPYMKMFGHVVGSMMAFADHAKHTGKMGVIEEAMVEAIKHCMLAHHGRLEWRSPVEPQTPEAWVLHAADMLSARS